MEADRSLRLNWGNNVPPALYSSPLVLNTWTHVAMVYDSSQASNQRMFYINGALDALSDWTTVPTTNSNDLFIGTDFYNSTSRWAYLGMMDDVRIYAEALTTSEIQHIMNPPSAADINGDGIVNLLDFGYTSAQWKTDGAFDPSADIAPDGGDGLVDMADLIIYIEQWLMMV
jgi:hypothetical protein